MKDLYVQGEVIVKEVENFPSGIVLEPSKENFNVLAYGETTGHVHCLTSMTSKLYKRDEKTFLECLEDTELKHQKLDGTQAKDAHKTIVLPKGKYKIGIVKEFDYFTEEARNVED